MYSHKLQEQKSHTKKNEMQNVHVVSRPKFPVLSNGVLPFAVSQIFCIGKWRKLFTETLLAFKPIFSIYDSTYRKTK